MLLLHLKRLFLDASLARLIHTHGLEIHRRPSLTEKSRAGSPLPRPPALQVAPPGPRRLRFQPCIRHAPRSSRIACLAGCALAWSVLDLASRRTAGADAGFAPAPAPRTQASTLPPPCPPECLYAFLSRPPLIARRGIIHESLRKDKSARDETTTQHLTRWLQEAV